MLSASLLLSFASVLLRRNYLYPPSSEDRPLSLSSFLKGKSLYLPSELPLYLLPLGLFVFNSALPRVLPARGKTSLLSLRGRSPPSPASLPSSWESVREVHRSKNVREKEAEKRCQGKGTPGKASREMPSGKKASGKRRQAERKPRKNAQNRKGCPNTEKVCEKNSWRHPIRKQVPKACERALRERTSGKPPRKGDRGKATAERRPRKNDSGKATAKRRPRKGDRGKATAERRPRKGRPRKEVQYGKRRANTEKRPNY